MSTHIKKHLYLHPFNWHLQAFAEGEVPKGKVSRALE
jgi:hypothetical protein